MVNEEIIRQIPIFRGLNDRAIKALSGQSVIRSYAKSQVLWRRDEGARGLHTVLEGRVRIIQWAHNRQHLVHIAESGQTIGEIPLFDGRGYPATAIAAVLTRSLFVTREGVFPAIQADAELAIRLIEGLSARVRFLVDHLTSYTIGTVRSRVASTLLALSSESEDGVAQVNGTQREWAEDIGTVREVLARELRRLKTDGMIEQEGRRRYRIVDESMLEAIALSWRED